MLFRSIRADLYDRPMRADMEFFTGKIFTMPDGTKHTVTTAEAQDIYFQLRMNGYITKSGEVTELLHTDLQGGTLKPLDDDLTPFSSSCRCKSLSSASQRGQVP